MARVKKSDKAKHVRDFKNRMASTNPKYVIYTDGGANQKVGGCGVVIQNWSTKKAIYLASFPLDSNNKISSNVAEMTAMIHALDKIIEINETDVVIFSDSMYVVEGIRTWLPKWINEGTVNGRPNYQLWWRIAKLVKKINFSKKRFMHCRGHVGIPGNELADYLATRAQKTGTKKIWHFSH